MKLKNATLQKESKSLKFLDLISNVFSSFIQAPQLVFFKEAVEHILRAVRVFRQPGGHMLLVFIMHI